MISVSEAKNIITDNVSALLPVILPLDEAAGLILAENVSSTIDVPTFDQSAMDGYAFCFDDYQAGKALYVNGEMPAGYSNVFVQGKGEAVRIFTGAPIPEGGDTVVMQEHTAMQNNELIIQDDTLKRGNNVRLRASDIKKGDIALESEIYLSPAAIGFLAGIGHKEVKVYPKPSVAMIVTGKELQRPGQPLQPGQVYESNSYSLQAALHQSGITDITTFWVDDDLNDTVRMLTKALSKADVVLITGGISVGTYDYVLQATTQCGITQLFHKVAQKPGKPLYFGKKGNQLIFGLPGNPSSVLTCFYEYVMPALGLLARKTCLMKTVHLPLSKIVHKKEGLTQFLKGWQDGNSVTPLQAQESYRMSSYARANCLICLEENGFLYAEGAVVEVHLLPF